MKFTKFIPVALALTLASPAFAVDDPAVLSAQSNLSIPVNHYVVITKDAETPTTTATFNSTYDQMTLADSLGVTFHVLTNKAENDVVTFTATCPTVESATNNALGGAIDNMKIAFAKSDRSGTQAGVTNALTSPAAGSNANVIAFTLTPTLTIDDTSGATAISTKSLSGAGVAQYTLPTSGVYNFKYATGQEAITQTFSTHDTYGTYQATLTMTHDTLDALP